MSDAKKQLRRKHANRAGVLAVGLVGIISLPFGNGFLLLELLQVFFMLAAFVLWMYAGIRGSRWWLIPPAIIFSCYAFLFTHGH